MKLIERIEAAEGPCRELDEAIVQLAYDKRWPLAAYNNKPINYDPVLWQERHDFAPTASLDAAMSLLPMMGEGDERRRADFILECTNGGLTISAMVGHADRDKCSWGSNEALALCAAALKAREAHND